METKTFKIAIEGMHCGNCATNVEKHLLSVNGVLKANVSLATNSGMVEFDKSVVDEAGIMSVFDDMSFNGTIVEMEDKLKLLNERKARAIKRRNRGLIEFAISAGLTAIVVAICMIPSLHMQIGHQMTNMIAFALTIPVQFVFGAKFYKGAYESIKSGMANMDVLVALGTTIAFFFSVYISFCDQSINSGMPYFETCCMLITFVMLGKLLEDRAKASAGDAVEKLIKLSPEIVTVLIDGEEVDKPLENIFPGDKIVVRKGDNFSVDGEIIEGRSLVDESMLTGEAEFVERSEGSEICAGTTNMGERVVVLAKSVGSDTQLSHIIQTVEDAESTKPKIQRTADKIASIFVPVIIFLALLTFFGWAIFEAYSGTDVSSIIKNALLPAIAVICVACPCALGLATPTAVMVGMGKGAELGILIKDGEMLETACKINNVIFDKTGTLTTGTVLDSNDDETIVQNDEVRLEARSAIKKLTDLFITCWMVSGDRKERALSISGEVGIENKHVRYEVLPTEKGEIVEEIRASLPEEATIAFVGDGINDAPALAKADVGIAMSSGTDIAIDAGSIVLMHNKVTDVAKAIELSKATMQKIKQNLFWALIYNCIMLPLAAFGILAPALAGFAMAMSSVCVVCNSLLLKRFS